MADEPTANELTTVGKITSTFGVKGWVKVLSYTQPRENIVRYGNWLIELDGRQLGLEVEACREHGNGMVAKFKGCEDREQARRYGGALIRIRTSELPALPDGECYWYQLEGLTVKLPDGRVLGQVAYLIETGSNDVLVVRPNARSIDVRERLLPYLPDQVIRRIDLDAAEIEVDWDPDF
jgi:16S rRNA processing protein RimM